jgi:hypothetical protein
MRFFAAQKNKQSAAILCHTLDIAILSTPMIIESNELLMYCTAHQA